MLCSERNCRICKTLDVIRAVVLGATMGMIAWWLYKLHLVGVIK